MRAPTDTSAAGWSGQTMNPRNDEREVLRNGELTVLRRIRSASNATFLCEATLGETSVHCVYKPVAGEAPLWDFPDGTLAGRERSAYLVSSQLGWNLVPYTIIRHGPAGPGMLQQWVQQPGDAVDADPGPARIWSTCFPSASSNRDICRCCGPRTMPATRSS